jgi:hypothetical protein
MAWAETLPLVMCALCCWAAAGCAVQPFLWYCLGVWAEVSSCFLAAHMTDLAPLRRGFFMRFPALCATNGAAWR